MLQYIYEVSLSSLSESLSAENGLESFTEVLQGIESNSLSIDKTNGEHIGTVIFLLKDKQDTAEITTETSDRLVKEFISKIKINPDKDNPTEHANALYSFINPTRNVMGLKAALQKGFDPGVLLNGHDVLEIAVQQTQGSIRTSRTTFQSTGFLTKQSQENCLKDIEMIKLMFRTGKIGGYLGDAGIEEARRIERIYETGKLPEEYSIQDTENPKFAAAIIGGDRIRIERDGDALDKLSATRAYLHQFHQRSILTDYRPRSQRLIANEVSLEQLDGIDTVSERTPNTNVFSRLCETLSGCFRSNRVGDSSRF